MNGSHPRQSLFMTAALVAVMAGGCTQKQMAGVPNPFLAPDRVPPPSTRMIAPGTAQPYYPGDPLPVMQSAAPQVAAPMVGATAPTDEPQKLVFSNEPSISVPSDESPLRFELPDPPEPEPTPIAAAAAQPIVPTTPIAASAAPPSGVMPAVYHAAPAMSPNSGNVMTASAATDPESSGPWRSPQIASAAAPPAAYVPAMQPIVSPTIPQSMTMPGYVVVPPITPLQASMDVSLRAVPSPAPVESSTPRIRLPGYPPPPVTLTPVPGSSLGASSDGFRPRSSMR